MNETSPPERWHSKEWIEQVSKMMEPLVEETHRKFYRRNNAYKCMKLGQRRYERSEKGKKARRETTTLRNSRLFKFRVSEEEEEMIWIFYEDCPQGCCVDHIIPLSRGGLHALANLQWLPISINSRKSSITLVPLSEYPHCRLDTIEIFNYT